MEVTDAARSALVVGASGAIGSAVTAALLARADIDSVHAASRTPPQDSNTASGRLHWHVCDNSEADISRVIAQLQQRGETLTRVVICSGILHDGDIQPEKALERISAASMLAVLAANTVTPMLWLAALAQPLRQSPDAVVAALSARVGSIGDNRLGGWYSYRASKAALNMALKTAAIELSRRAPATKLIAFHPGTTDSELSKPFQARVPADKLFEPSFVAARLLTIMDNARPDGALAYLDWAGEPIPW